MKNFFASKINWAAIVLCLTAIIPAINDFDGVTWKDYSKLIIGILIIIFRTYFTNTTIAAPPATK